MNEITKEIIELAAKGNQYAMEDLYRLTYSSVYKAANVLIQDEDAVLDIVQDSYIKAFQSLDQLDSPENFRAWIKRIATNKAKDYLKKKKPILFSEMASEDGEEIDFRDECLNHLPEEVLDRRETTRLMDEILATLTEDQRMAIGLHYYQDLSVKEIAVFMGCSENTVKSRLNYGRKKVEAKVRELEKRGTRLYSLAPLPFLLWLFRMDAEAAEIPSPAVWKAITAKNAAHPVVSDGTGGMGTKAAVHAGAKGAAGAGTKALATKIIAGVLAVSVAGGGAILALSSNDQKQAAPTQQPVFTGAAVHEETERLAETILPAQQNAADPETPEETTEIPGGYSDIPAETVSGASYDSVLADIQTVLEISAEEYDSDMDYYDTLYSHLGDGVVWMLLHRESGIYTLGVWNTYMDIDGDGQEELVVGRGVSPGSVTPIVIYRRNGDVIFGDALYACTDLFLGGAPVEWNYLGG